MRHGNIQAGCVLTILITLLPLQGNSLDQAIQKGEDLTGRNIRIKISKSFPEVPAFTNGAFQVGNGDCFQYMLYVEYLQNLGARVLIDLPDKLKPYFAKTTSLMLSDAVDTANYEEIQLADLFHLLLNRVPNFDRAAPFFTCPEEIVLKWDKEIKKRTGGTLIPIVFFMQGAPHHLERFPVKEEWEQLTKDMPQVVFFNAQLNGVAINNSVRMCDIDLSSDNVAYLDTFGLIFATVVLNNGFVISPDTGSLHLCASGVEGNAAASNRVFGVLAKHPDQRWRLSNFMKNIEAKIGVNINKCVWYPKSVLLFQQTEDGNFLPVIEAMKEYINSMSAAA